MEILDPRAFVRHPGAGNFEEYKQRERSFVNSRNLFWIPKRRIFARLTVANQELSLAYRFELVRNWILSGKPQNTVFIWRLRYLLRKLGLFAELNAYEHNYLALSENLIFTRERSIKDLAVDFAKRSGETVGFHYDGITVAQALGKKQATIIAYGDVYLSNQRLVFSDSLQLFFLFNKDIAEAQIGKDALIFMTRSGLEFRVLCDAPLVLLTAFEKISG